MSKDNFRSRIGIIAATAGSAIGLGNLWGFPYKAGVNGGGTFMVFYLFCVIFVGVPIMLSEFIIGRAGQGGVIGAVENLDGKKSKFLSASYLGAFTCFSILSFYCVIAGWALNYFCTYLIPGFGIFADGKSGEIFNDTISNFTTGSFYQILFIIITMSIVVLGIREGIEKITKLMMPILFLIIFGMVLYNVTLPGFGEAAYFLFVPKAPESGSYFNVAISALGQAFFSLSVGMGAVITYAQYVDKKEDINKITLSVVVADTLIAVLAGLAVFPIIFSTEGIEASEGAGLAFVSLTAGFANMPFGHIVGVIFFFLLIIAALTSSVSLMEIVAVAVMEKSKLNRKMATFVSATAAAFIGIYCQIGANFQFPLFNFASESTLLDQLDKLTMHWTIPIGAFIFSIFTGHRLDKKIIRDQINNDKISNIFIPYVKFVIPVFIAIIFLGGIDIKTKILNLISIIF